MIPTLRALALTLIATGLAAGCAERVAPPPKGPALFVDCRGPVTAAPTVILEAGAFGAAADWDLVLTDLAKRGRTCAYDRAGIGRSPDRPGGRDAAAIAADLRGLLDRLGETRPVILVGHSNGALYVETFAALYPQRVAGLVYINGVTSDALDDPLLVKDLTQERDLARLAALGGDLGMASAVSDILSDQVGLSGEAARRKRESLADPAALKVARDEDQAVIGSLAATRKLGGPPSAIPTVAISGSTDPQAPLSQAWKAASAASARRATAHWILEAPGATHTSPLVRDRGYVAAGVDWLRGMAR